MRSGGGFSFYQASERRRQGIIMKNSNNIKVIRKGDKAFPEFLSDMEDGPEILYCIGDTSLLKERAAAVVGARKCSEDGRQTALRIGSLLAKNEVVTVSGMACGIDSAAHLGALRQDGKTIAVLGSGPDICYPRSSEKIYKSICDRGLIVSEYPPGTEPRPWRFPMRNRIISALSEVVTVIEAGDTSGSLITAVRAAEQGREVLAVPGNISSPFSLGTNRLIADGAGILTAPEDILRAMGIDEAASNMTDRDMGKDEKEVFDIVMKRGQVTIDELSRESKRPPSDVSGIVAVMELKGILSYSMGKIFIAKM